MAVALFGSEVETDCKLLFIVIMCYLPQHHCCCSCYQQVEICLWTNVPLPGCTGSFQHVSCQNFPKGWRKKRSQIRQTAVWAHPSSLFITDDYEVSHLEKGTNTCLSVMNKTNRTNRATSCWHFSARILLSQSNIGQGKQWLTLSPLEGNAKHYSVL